MPSPILARADALIQRHRPRNGTPEEVPVLTDFDEQQRPAEFREPVEVLDETPVVPMATPTPTAPATEFLDFEQATTEAESDDDIPVLMDAEPPDPDLPPPLFPPTPATAAPNGLFAQLHAALDREAPDVSTTFAAPPKKIADPTPVHTSALSHPEASSSTYIDNNSLDESHLQELCQRIEARLSIVLPRLIEEVLDDYLQERQLRHHD